MWFILLTIVHIMVSLFLVLVVLLQAGKGSGMGVTFGGGGGGSTAVLGAGGATTLLGKMTVVSAVVFMLTSFGLTYLSSTTNSVLELEEAQEEDSMGVAPEDKDKEAKEQGAGAAGEKAEDKKEAPAAAPKKDGEAAPAGDKAAPAGDKETGAKGADGKPAIPGAVYEDNGDGTGTVTFDMVPDGKGNMKAVAPEGYDPAGGKNKPDLAEPVKSTQEAGEAGATP
jgi:preprotein translocase subunit SecG